MEAWERKWMAMQAPILEPPSSTDSNAGGGEASGMCKGSEAVSPPGKQHALFIGKPQVMGREPLGLTPSGEVHTWLRSPTSAPPALKPDVQAHQNLTWDVKFG
eukprot:1137815-Pelagomonas_calceolata.AAC.3